jgi:DNA-directed RNA polymerase sigma subunit (sigma70/sigma32)
MDDRYAAKSFAQIAAELGVSKKAVQQTYLRAMRKLRRNRPRSLRPIVQLASLLAEMREKRERER